MSRAGITLNPQGQGTQCRTDSFWRVFLCFIKEEPMSHKALCADSSRKGRSFQSIAQG